MSQTDKLKLAQEKLAVMRAEGWKPVVLNPGDRAKANPNSVKDADPGVRQRVRDCFIPSCALWPHHPWQTIGGALSEFGLPATPACDAEDDPDGE